jgi:DNA-binding MarR family transcriptional regulator
MKKPVAKTATLKKTASLYELPGHLIRRCHQISVALFLQECAAFGITPQQYAVVRVLADHDGADQITVAGLAAFNRTTAGELVARMEEAGYLTRVDSSNDRRVKNLFLTKVGRNLLKDVEASVHRVQERLLEPLDKTERKQFIDCLARIAKVNNELSRAPLRHPRASKGSEPVRTARNDTSR